MEISSIKAFAPDHSLITVHPGDQAIPGTPFEEGIDDSEYWDQLFKLQDLPMRGNLQKLFSEHGVPTAISVDPKGEYGVICRDEHIPTIEELLSSGADTSIQE